MLLYQYLIGAQKMVRQRPSASRLGFLETDLSIMEQIGLQQILSFRSIALLLSQHTNSSKESISQSILPSSSPLCRMLSSITHLKPIAYVMNLLW